MPYPKNPDYGSGIFRRRIALSRSTRLITAELEDCNHAFRLQLHFDDNKVTTIEAQAIRYPLSTCPFATAALEEFTGKTLTASRFELRDYSAPNIHCTHLYDLVGLCMNHALRHDPHRQYDIEIPDPVDAKSTARLYCNHQLVLEWEIEQHHINTPRHLAGKPVMKGFSYWAMSTFQGDALEAAFVLQMGYFVASARRYDINAMAGQQVGNQRIPLGACYSYSKGIIEQAIRMPNSMRDFTDNEAQLLKFSEPLNPADNH